MQPYEIGGTIRPGSNGEWYLLSDSEHVPVHLSGQVVMGSDYIRVYFSGRLTHINWTAITTDETLAIWGYTCGGSVNMDHVNIYIGKNGQAVNPRTITGSTANIWLYIRGEINS